MILALDSTLAHSRPLLFLLGAAHSANHSLFLVLPQVLVLVVDELNISKFAIGTVAMIASLLYGAGSLVGGALSDRIGERRIVVFSLAFSGFSTIIFLFATELFVFGLGMLLMGMLAGLYHPAANALISKIFREKMGESMGIHGVGGSLGIMFTPVVAALLGTSFGWRIAFFFFGILCVVLSMIFYFGTYELLEPEPQSIEKEGRVLKLSSLWFLLVLNITIGLYMKGVELFFQTYVMSYTFNNVNIELSSFIAATAASSLLAAGVAGQLLGGRATDAFGSKKVLIVTSGGVVISLLSLQLLSIPILGVGVFAILYGLSFYAHQPAFNSQMRKKRMPRILCLFCLSESTFP